MDKIEKLIFLSNHKKHILESLIPKDKSSEVNDYVIRKYIEELVELLDALIQANKKGFRQKDLKNLADETQDVFVFKTLFEEIHELPFNLHRLDKKIDSVKRKIRFKQ